MSLIPSYADWSSATEIVSAGTAPDWDAHLGGAYTPCCCIKFNGIYFLYYIGSLNDVGPDERSLGVATSSDGTNWSKYGSNPLFTFAPNTEDEEGIFSFCVLEDAGTLYGYYGGLRGPSPPFVDIEIRARKSTDGYTWTDDTLIYQDSGQEHSPVACYKDGSNWYVYYLANLQGGAGDIRLRSGTAWDTLSTDQLVLAVDHKDGSVQWLTDEFLAYFAARTADGQITDAYTIEHDAPTTLGNVRKTLSFALDDVRKQPAYYLDEANGLWRLFQGHITAPNDINMRTAPLNSCTVWQSSDDAEEQGTSGIGTPDLDSTDLELNYDPGTADVAQTIGLRFDGVAVPVTAQITNAYITFVADGASSGSLTFTISGELALDPGTFTVASQNITDRAKTVASVSWSPGAWSDTVEYDTPNLAAVVQEIVEQASWNAGNAMVFIIPPDTGTDTRRAEAFDGDITAAKLTVEYSLGTKAGVKQVIRQGYPWRESIRI